MAFMLVVGGSQAQELMIGIIGADGRTALLHENLEGSYDNPGKARASGCDGYGRTDVHIREVVKTATSDGVLSINCESELTGPA